MDKRKGFTFVEVSLFLAVTAALFIGIALGMQNAITQQRYNDATQNFLEFMRSIYSKVSNPQSPGNGNSQDYAIYGKLVVFGETHDILGAPVEGQPIFTYDVVGKVDHLGVGSGEATNILVGLDVNVVRQESDQTILATPEKYEMRWQMSLEKTDRQAFKGSILVVRHPLSGTINTLVLDETINVNEVVHNADKAGEVKDLLKRYLGSGSGAKFAPEEINFCVSPYPLGETGVIPRQNIRVLKNARNASSVEMIDQDSEDNQCSK